MSDTKDLKLRIKEALEAFATGDLSASALHLLKTLGYSAPRLNYFTKGSFAEFEDNFGGNNVRFSKNNALHEQWKRVDVLFQLTGNDLGAQQGIFQNERVDNTIIESYLFFVLELKPKKDNTAYTRTDLSHITREVNKCFAMPAMILFKHPGTGAGTGSDTLSFAVIDRRLHKRESSKDVLEKVTLIKDIRTTGPHRAHIEILFDLGLEQLRKKHDVPNFPKLHEAWRKTLDTKELNKRFFRELSNWYFHAVEVTQWPADAEPDKDKRNAINTIRLITRLMFVWFLREKDLVPDALFDPRELKKILRPDAKEPSAYYKAILQNLFFATLNTEMGKRRFLAKPDSSQSPHHFIHNVFRYEHCFTDPKRTLKELFDPIPFLNGGLFECLDKQVETKGKLVPVRIDGFSNNPKNPLLVPDKLFFDPEGEEYDFSEVYGTTRARKEKVRGLIDILSSYKFTITENTPIEEEVALDPELLGKVFENLLANYNPETKTTARKQTGSFYTPREIVNYMVDESLIAYLKTSLEAPVRADDRPPTKAQDDIETRLRHLLSYTEEAHQFTKAETEKLIAAIDTCKILDPACGSGAFPMGVLHKLVHVLHKLDPQNKQWKERQVEKASQLDDADIRERTIADIEDAFANNALDYGRKLYLIENGIYGVDIQPIAMQIAKLRFFISLVVDQRVDAKRPNLGVRPLPNLETKFVAANTLMKLKPREQLQIFDTEGIDELKDELKWVRHDYFEARTPQRKAKCREQDKLLREKLAALLMQNQGYEPEEAKMLAAWDPYDQNASAPFFDPEWMYGLSTGFEVIIGNPPYIYNRDLPEKERSHFQERFGGSDDLYVYFTYVSDDLLAKDGVLTFLTPNTYFTLITRARYRQRLLERSNLKLAYTGFSFENAYVETMIFTYQKSQQSDELVTMISDPDDWPEMKALEVRKEVFLSNYAYRFFWPTSLNLNLYKRLIRRSNEPLREHASLVTGKEVPSSRVANTFKPGSIVPLGLICAGEQGLVTGNNSRYVAVIVDSNHDERRIAERFLRLLGSAVGKEITLAQFDRDPDKYYRLAELVKAKNAKPDYFGKFFLYRTVRRKDVRSFEKLTKDERLNGTTEKRFIFYQQGNTDGHRWSIPYAEAIEWSKRAVEELKEGRVTNSRWQGDQYFDTTGFGWVDYFTNQIKAFYVERGVYSKNVVKFHSRSDHIDDSVLTCLLNSTALCYLVKNFVTSTHTLQINDGRLIPIAIPDRGTSARLTGLLEKIRAMRKDLPNANVERVEREIDEVVYGLYGLTEEEIRIVEGSVKRKGGAAAEMPNGQDGEEAAEASTPRKRGRPRKG